LSLTHTPAGKAGWRPYKDHLNQGNRTGHGKEKKETEERWEGFNTPDHRKNDSRRKKPAREHFHNQTRTKQKSSDKGEKSDSLYQKTRLKGCWNKGTYPFLTQRLKPSNPLIKP